MSDMNNYRNDFLNGIKAAQGLPQGPNQPPRVEQGGPGMINCTNDNRPGIYSNLQGNMVFSPNSVHAIKPGMEAIPQTQPPMYNHPMPQQQMPFPQRPMGMGMPPMGQQPQMQRPMYQQMPPQQRPMGMNMPPMMQNHQMPPMGQRPMPYPQMQMQQPPMGRPMPMPQGPQVMNNGMPFGFNPNPPNVSIIPNNVPFRYQVPPDEAVPILPADLVNMKTLETGKIDFANPDSVQKVADPFGYQSMNQNPNIGRRPNGVTNPSAYRPNSAPNINNIPVYGGKYRPFNSVPMGYGSTSSDLDFMAPTQEEIDRGLVPEVVTDPEEIKKMEEEEREAMKKPPRTLEQIYKEYMSHDNGKLVRVPHGQLDEDELKYRENMMKKKFEERPPVDPTETMTIAEKEEYLLSRHSKEGLDLSKWKPLPNEEIVDKDKVFNLDFKKKCLEYAEKVTSFDFPLQQIFLDMIHLDPRWLPKTTLELEYWFKYADYRINKNRLMHKGFYVPFDENKNLSYDPDSWSQENIAKHVKFMRFDFSITEDGKLDIDDKNWDKAKTYVSSNNTPRAYTETDEKGNIIEYKYTRKDPSLATDEEYEKFKIVTFLKMQGFMKVKHEPDENDYNRKEQAKLVYPTDESVEEDNPYYNPYDPYQARMHYAKLERAKDEYQYKYFRQLMAKKMTEDEFNDWWYQRTGQRRNYKPRQLTEEERFQQYLDHKRMLTARHMQFLDSLVPVDTEVRRANYLNFCENSWQELTDGVLDHGSLRDFCNNLSHVKYKMADMHIEEDRRKAYNEAIRRTLNLDQIPRENLNPDHPAGNVFGIDKNNNLTSGDFINLSDIDGYEEKKRRFMGCYNLHHKGTIPMRGIQ